MFRPMRRKSRAISDEETRQLLHEARRGVLAVNGDDGYPYAVPINFYYDELNQKIYFHGAHQGHKIDAMNACDKVCFTVYGDEIVEDPDMAWAPYLKSAVVFGRCHLLGTGEENYEQMKLLSMKFYPEESIFEEGMAKEARAVRVWAIDIEHMTGKKIREK